MNDTNTSAKWMFWLALAAAVLGLGIGLATLIAPMGVWLGLWPFGTGFNILRRAVPLTSWIALFSLLVAIVLFVMSRKHASTKVVKLSALALIGALAAGIAWYVPSTFQGEFPPIHDVSTDTVNPPAYVAVLPLRADAPNPVEYGISRAVPQEDHARVQMEAFPDLSTRVLNINTDVAFDRALAAINSMGLEVVDANREEGRIEATDTTFWFRFKDDVVIRIQAQGPQTLLDARSLSRVGVGDAGTNARRLREFFAEFDQQ